MRCFKRIIYVFLVADYSFVERNKNGGENIRKSCSDFTEPPCFKFFKNTLMALIYEEELRGKTLKNIARKMMVAARTAPKGRGIDYL